MTRLLGISSVLVATAMLPVAGAAGAPMRAGIACVPEPNTGFCILSPRAPVTVTTACGDKSSLAISLSTDAAKAGTPLRATVSGAPAATAVLLTVGGRSSVSGFVGVSSCDARLPFSASGTTSVPVCALAAGLAPACATLDVTPEHSGRALLSLPQPGGGRIDLTAVDLAGISAALLVLVGALALVLRRSRRAGIR